MPVPAGTRRNLDALAWNFRLITKADAALSALAVLAMAVGVGCACWRPGSEVSFITGLICGVLGMILSGCWSMVHGGCSLNMQGLRCGAPPEHHIPGCLSPLFYLFYLLSRRVQPAQQVRPVIMSTACPCVWALPGARLNTARL